MKVLAGMLNPVTSIPVVRLLTEAGIGRVKRALPLTVLAVVATETAPVVPLLMAVIVLLVGIPAPVTDMPTRRPLTVDRLVIVLLFCVMLPIAETEGPPVPLLMAVIVVLAGRFGPTTDMPTWRPLVEA